MAHMRNVIGRMAAAVFVLVALCGGCCVGDVVSKKSNRYLAHIFNKYGSHGTIGFEGLEHLLHSLHLGGVEFGPTHTVDEHRPKDFKLPDIAVNVSYTHDQHDHHGNELHHQHDLHENRTINVTSTGAISTNNTLNSNGDRSNNTNNTNNTNNNTLGTSTGSNQLDDDMWNEELWLDTTFKQLHDPKHRHPRHRDDQILDACLSPIQLMHVALNHEQRRHSHRQRRHMEHHHSGSADNTDTDTDDDYVDDDNDGIATDATIAEAQITPDIFLDMCPLLLLQLDQRACSYDVRASPMLTAAESATAGNSHGLGLWMSWIYASISILIISMCGLAGVAIVPLTKSGGYQNLLQFLVAVAVGTLCGDALMHLLPHALVPHGDEPLPTLFTGGDRALEPVWLCFCAFMTALGMYALETSLPLLGGGGGGGHQHTHSHGPPAPKPPPPEPLADTIDSPVSVEITPKNGDEIDNMLQAPLAQKHSRRRRLSPVAFMVLLGDGLHNITDGMAIGAAFAVDPVTGMATALAVLCHELPHELGDFALLLQTGVSVRRALVFNVASSVLSAFGMALGLVVAGASATMVRWIYAGTAGTFLYIALADLVPEMRGGVARQQSGIEVAVQVIGVLAGGVLMLAIALYEERLRMLFE